MRAVASVLLTLIAAPAFAHNVGCDGKKVPAHVKISCCGEADAHLLDPDQVQQTGVAYLVRDGGHLFVVDKKNAEPSADGCYWIFYNPISTSGPGNIPVVYCFQLPFSM